MDRAGRQPARLKRRWPLRIGIAATGRRSRTASGDPPRSADVFQAETRFTGSLAMGLLAFIVFVCPWMGIASLLWLRQRQARPL